MRILFIGLLLCLSFQIPLHTQIPYYPSTTHYFEPNSEGREHEVDIERMVIAVSFDAVNGIVRGDVTHTFRPIRERVDSIVFDGLKMNIKEAYIGAKKVKYVVNDSTVVVYPDHPLMHGVSDSVRFVYDCTPRRGMHFTGWRDSTNRTRKQIWTQGEDSDNRHWCPMYDYPNDKMITETYVTFDSAYKVLSNGNLINSQLNNDGTKTWHYAMTQPHVSYLVMIAIGKYAIDERKTKRGLPVHLYYYPEYPERIQPTYKFSTEIIEFMEDQLGVPYPWESYAQVPVQDYIFGAMENTTATVFGDFSQTDARGNLDRNYLNTNVHELTHMWFGDYITERNWKSIWLHESFATFYPKLFQRKYFGEDTYQWMRRSEQNQSLGAGANDRLPVVSFAGGTARRYQKGSAVLDMLRYLIGEKNFDRAVNRYLKTHAYALVHTDEFYLAFHDELGWNLDWFFDEWLYRGGEPSYKVEYNDIVDAKSGDRKTMFSVEQTQIIDELCPLFRMPIVFEVHYTDGTFSSLREVVEKQQQNINVPNPQKKQIAFTLFDPGSYIIKKIDFKKSFEELKQQAANASNMIDRYDAVRVLHEDSTFSEDETEKFLVGLYVKEKFHAVKSEIVTRMTKSKSETATALLRKAITDKDVEVRKAVINNLRRVDESLRADIEKLLADSSYAVIETTLTKLCESFPKRSDEYLTRVATLESPAARVRISVLERRAATKNQGAIDSLNNYSSSSFEFQTRQNAMSALRRLNICDERTAKNLVDAMLSQNNRLSDAARGHVEYFLQQSNPREIFQSYYRSGKWERWQREILAKVLGERLGRMRRR